MRPFDGQLRQLIVVSKFIMAIEFNNNLYNRPTAK